MSATPGRSAIPRPPSLLSRRPRRGRGAPPTSGPQGPRRQPRRGRLIPLVAALGGALLVVAVIWPVDHAAAELIRLLLAVGASIMEILSWLARTDRPANAEGGV